MKIIIAEKPSVAKNIADALKITTRADGYYEGSEYCITWAFGHLLELYDAKDYDEKMTFWHMNNFPFVPDTFEYKIKNNRIKKRVDDGAKKQLACIKKLIAQKNVDGVISACDYDREGQIIGDIILNYLEVKKPVYRILLNEWTQDEVLRGLQNIVPNEQLKPLQDAGISRQQADWLIGINLTSVATLKYKSERGQLFNIGRVLLPTLKMIYDRDKEIEKFVSKPYYKLTVEFEVKDNLYTGIYTYDKKERFDKKEDISPILDDIINKPSCIINKEVTDKKEYPFPLFNLSALQGYITSKYQNFTSDKVLQIAQSLYEKKFITYPRTASNVLEESLVDKTRKVVNTLKVGLPYENEIIFKKLSRVFNSKKVEGHSAITPTYQRPKSLGYEEQIVYDAIVNRFLAQFMPVAEIEETVITTEVKPFEGVFITKGKILKVEGWKKIESDKNNDILLPNVDKGDVGIVKNAEIIADKTKPPKFYNEKTLLRAMETCGKQFKDEDGEVLEEILAGFSIGTPATRADTIKKLCDTQYIIRKKKNLTCTPKGRAIIETLPVKELMDLEYTGKLEKALSDIEKGEISKTQFMNHITRFVTQAVVEIKRQNTPPLKFDNSVEPMQNKKTTPAKSEKVSLGKCPICGEIIIEGAKGYGCMGYKNGCWFVLWKEDEAFVRYNKKLTKTAVKTLLSKNEVLVKGFKTKNNTKFDAIISLEVNNTTKTINWKFAKP